MNNFHLDQFNLSGKVAIVTGATGVLGGAIAHGLAGAGANVGILGRRIVVAVDGGFSAYSGI